MQNIILYVTMKEFGILNVQFIKMLLTQDSSDRGGNGDGALKKSWTEVGARWFLIGFDRRGQIAHLSEFFWTRDWNPPLFGLDPLS